MGDQLCSSEKQKPLGLRGMGGEARLPSPLLWSELGPLSSWEEGSPGATKSLATKHCTYGRDNKPSGHASLAHILDGKQAQGDHAMGSRQCHYRAGIGTRIPPMSKLGFLLPHNLSSKSGRLSAVLPTAHFHHHSNLQKYDIHGKMHKLK